MGGGRLPGEFALDSYRCSVALVEIVLGVLAGNTLGFRTNDWINFLASFGAVLLTFLAGAEIDPASLRQHLKASLSIGTIAFFAPSPR